MTGLNLKEYNMVKVGITNSSFFICNTIAKLLDKCCDSNNT